MKRIISVMVAVLLLSSCTLKSDSALFSEYADAYFRSSVSSNGLTFNYLLNDPEEFGIETYPTTLGRYGVKDSAEKTASLEAGLSELREFDREKLTDEQKIVYDLIEYQYELALEATGLEYYSEPLKAYSGIQSNLPMLLSEFRIETVKDAEQYILLVRDIPACFQSIIEFEKQKSEKGLFMSDENADVVISDCESAIKNKKIMYTSFEERIAETDFTEEEKASFIEQNNAAVDEVFESSYKNLITEIKKLKGTGSDYDSLAELPQGNEYYEYLTKSYTGTEYSVSEIAEMLDEDIKIYRDRFYDCASQNTEEYYSENFGMKYEVSDPYEIMTYLYDEMSADYPAVPDYTANIKYMDGETSSNPAYYLTAPIDAADEAVIYINDGYYGNSFYPTVAHEGIPGHMYQSLYFSGVCGEPIRYVLSCDGYVEGWGTYVERESYYYAGENSDASVELTVSNSLYTLALIARTDIGVNYEGWTLDQCDDFYEFNHLTPSTSEYYYALVKRKPASYMPYYLGYKKIMELREYSEHELGSLFRLRDYHTAILDAGPVPLSFLDGVVDRYIEKTFEENQPREK